MATVTTETPIRIGVMGCAEIAREVSRAINLAPNTTIAAVASRSLEKAKTFATANGYQQSVKIHGSYESILGDSEVDALYIPLPTSLHVEWAIRAAESGKHILLEKPVAMNIAEFDKIVAACEKNGVQMMDGTMWAHHPGTAKLKEFLFDSDRFGQLKNVHSCFSLAGDEDFLKNDIRVKPNLDGLCALGDLGCKSATSYMKIRLDIVRKRRIAMVKFLKMDIVEFLKNGLDYNAYTRAEVLLEELRIISCYDVLERFCDCISENLSLMLKKRECPEECREAVSSLVYAAAWVPDVPELKDLRAVFTRRFGSFIASSVNYELVEKTELRRRPSRELNIETVKDIAKEFSIDWDPTALHLLLLRQTSALQIEDKVEPGADDPQIETKKSDDPSEDESILSQSWTRYSLSKGSLSSSSSSSFGSPRRDSEKKKKKKILPYGIISPSDTKPGARNDEETQEEKEEKKKSIDQESSKLLKPQGSDKEASSTRKNERTLSFHRPKLLDYDDVVARLAALRRR